MRISGTFLAGLAAVFFSLLGISCQDSTSVSNDPAGEVIQAEYIRPIVLDTFPHDPGAFTQGLLLKEGVLYESTGIYGQSSFRRVELQTGRVLQQILIGSRFFGEGLALKDDRFVQLTWQENTAFVYSSPQMALVDTFTYTTEGWGLTSDSTYFIMSDGSEKLYFRNERFKLVKTLRVTLDGQPLYALNELEYARGMIYANVWKKDWIVEIIPHSGEVRRVIDCRELVNLEKPGSANAVLNGIAYNPGKNTFYCTGKLWNHIFEIRID